LVCLYIIDYLGRVEHSTMALMTTIYECYCEYSTRSNHSERLNRPK